MVVFLGLANQNWNFWFVNFSTKTDRNGWNSIGFSFDRLSVFGALSLGQLGLWFFFPKNFLFGLFKKKYIIQASCFLALLGPFMLFVIKPFLETYFRPFLGTSFGPDSGLFFILAIFRNFFGPFLGIITNPYSILQTRKNHNLLLHFTIFITCFCSTTKIKKYTL